MENAANVKAFMRHHFRHFNAAALVDAAQGYETFLAGGGRMLLAMAGAMSTAELGLSLAEMIRRGKIHAISCTGANLEEDIYNLVAHDHYVRIPNWRDLTPEDEHELLGRHLNRVTDTCIPEEEAIRRIEDAILDEWVLADRMGERYFPHEFLYRVLRSGRLERFYQIDPKDSWMVAACEKNLPIFVPGWEDSTSGNIYASHCISGAIQNVHTVRGGIAGDFPICVVPMLRQDLQMHDTPLWGYFCQISDSTTSYGSYSGAVPNEKITWEKLDISTPKFLIESDATIVAPLIFAYVLAS